MAPDRDGKISESLLSEKILPQYLDEQYWNPKGKNFHILDWNKWDAKNPHPPKVYNPPQLRAPPKYSELRHNVNYWSHRSPLLTPCGISRYLHNNCKVDTKTASDMISNDSLFEDFLDPYTESDDVPDFLRGIFWMKDNVGAETLITFQNWAWRPRPKNGGTVAVGSTHFNWTTDPTLFGCFWGWKLTSNTYVNVQIHPEGKWVAMAFFKDPNDEEVVWQYLYVVQEGDEFELPSGEKADFFRPGNLIRVSWDGGDYDPYFFDNEKLNYSYLPRRVAIRGKNGKMEKVQPDFDLLRKKATQNYKKQPACCGHCTCNMNAAERAELMREELSNEQFWSPTPPPPKASMIDRF